jgi:hypothetical protein
MIRIVLLYRLPCQVLTEAVVAALTLLYAGIFEQSMGAYNRVGIGWWYRPASLHRLAELIPWNRFLGSLKV